MMKLPKFDDRWDTGIYVGLVEGTNEIRVLTPKGALRVNSVKRLPQAQRRDPELVKVVVGLPWEPVPSGAPRPKRVGVSFVPVVPEEEAPESSAAPRGGGTAAISYPSQGGARLVWIY